MARRDTPLHEVMSDLATLERTRDPERLEDAFQTWFGFGVVNSEILRDTAEGARLRRRSAMRDAHRRLSLARHQQDRGDELVFLPEMDDIEEDLA